MLNSRILLQDFSNYRHAITRVATRMQPEPIHTFCILRLWHLIRGGGKYHTVGAISLSLHSVSSASYTNSAHFLLWPIILSWLIPLPLPAFCYTWALLLSFFPTLDLLPALLLHIGLDLLFSLSIRYPFQTYGCTTEGALLFINSGQFSIVLRSWIRNDNLDFFYI